MSNDMPEEIFATETDPIYGSGEYLHQDCYQGLRNPNDTTYVRKDLTDRRDAVDELIDATRQLMIMRDDDGELSAEAGETIQAILEARGNE